MRFASSSSTWTSWVLRRAARASDSRPSVTRIFMRRRAEWRVRHKKPSGEQGEKREREQREEQDDSNEEHEAGHSGIRAEDDRERSEEDDPAPPTSGRLGSWFRMTRSRSILRLR